MVGTHFETGQIRASNRGSQTVRSTAIPHSAFRTPNSAFTLTELLVVITIIAILASLITGAALRALNNAKRAAITAEMKQLDGALQEFKNEYGMYPPNIYANATIQSNQAELRLNQQVLERALKKISSRSTEFNFNVSPGPQNNVWSILDRGLSPAEALVFWLQGFSADITRPLSGTDLEATQIDDNGTTVNNVITIDSFTPRFEFDRGRLRFSRDSNGNRRYLEIWRPNDNAVYQLQLYEYFPKNSQQPYVYFDVSRETPLQVVDNWEATEFFYSNPTTGGKIFPLKQVRPDAPQNRGDWQNPQLQYIDYVEKDKFQIMHAGLDDIWGDFGRVSNDDLRGELDLSNNNNIPSLLAPEGPFIGDIADTLGNFMTGTLAEKQE